jgi:catechol 2,3-dioxygenase-like lactoylglutathione lyase family enzyme
MKRTIFQLSLVVRDYDEAIAFYCEKLKFTLLEDTLLSEGKRWVVVAPGGSTGCSLLLAKATNDEQLSRVGNQTGGRVFLFLHTDDIKRDISFMQEQGVQIVRPPHVEVYGTVAVFADLYGNLWDLIEPAAR